MSDYSNFEFSITDADETGLVLVSMTDTRTGFTVRTPLPNHGKQTAAIMAFAGARYSRSDLSAKDLLREIHESGKNANEKLAAIFRNYGHASVADMAMLFAYIENIPQIYAFKFFYETSVGGGQERSTRYQDFSSNSFVKLDNFKHYFSDAEVSNEEYEKVNSELQKLQASSIDRYNKYVGVLTGEYQKVYAIDEKDKNQTGALKARVFDSSRYFLLSGMNNRTSLAYITSGREWARIISMMKSSSDLYLNYLGEQLEVLFAPDEKFASEIGYTPEAPDLIRHTDLDETTNNNLKELDEYLKKEGIIKELAFEDEVKFHPISVSVLNSSFTAGFKMIVQNILMLFPTASTESISEWLLRLSDEKVDEISKIVCKGHNHHKQMGNQFRVNHYSFEITSSIAEARDMNRHRAWGRFIPLLSSESDYSSFVQEGYTLPLYLSDNDKIKKEIVEEFESDLRAYYKELSDFVSLVSDHAWFPKAIISQLLPFANICRMYFHGSVKELSYISKLRIRPGGHINYRLIAFLMANAAAKSDKYLSGIEFDESEKPDPASRSEFVDRG